MGRGYAKSRLLKKYFRFARKGEVVKQAGNFSPLAASSVGRGLFPPYISKYYNFYFSYLVLASKKKYGTIFFDWPSYLECSRASWQRYSNLSYKEKFPERIDFLKIQKIAKELYQNYTPEKYAKLSSGELHRHFKIILDNIAKLLAATVFSESLDEKLALEFYESLGGDVKKFHRFFSLAAKPAFLSFVSRFDEELLRAYRSGKIENLQWVFCDYYAAPQIQEIKNLLRDVWKKKGSTLRIKAEIQRMKKTATREKVAAHKFKKTLSLKEQKLFDFIQLSLYTRDYRKEALHKLYTMICNVVRELLSRCGIFPDLAAFATTKEILEKNYIKKGYGETLAERSRGELTFIERSGVAVELVDYESTEKELFSLVEKSDLSVKKIRGNVAYRGKVTGRAFVIQHEGEFSKFQDGGILITSMTRPEYVPLIKRAKAIITDEGGITCHAAIVAREMKKPCIIGTKIATKVLHDGDLVEVDANNSAGVIRIMRRKYL